MFEIIKRIRKVKGAGYSEIMLVLSLISMISVASFKTFGNTARHQVSGLATELSGQTYDSAPLNTITEAVEQQSNSSNSNYSNSAVPRNVQVSTANTSNENSDNRVLVPVDTAETVAQKEEVELAGNEQQASQGTSTNNTSQSNTSSVNPAEQSTVAIIINNLDEFRAGFVEGAESQANELIQIILHPIETAKGIIKLVDLLMENPQQVLDAMIEELGQNAKDILSGDPRKIGKVIGENLSPAAMLKVVAKASKAVASLLKKEYTPSCCCFAKGTPVSTPEGFKAIDQLRIGDLVQSKNEFTGEMHSKPVSQLFLTKGKQLYALTTLNSKGLKETVEVTDNHPYWVEGEWIESAKLKPGMVLTDEAGQQVKVLELQEIGKTQDTYNIEVADFHTYFVGKSKVLVHNECACKLDSKSKKLEKGKEFVQEFENFNSARDNAKKMSGLGDDAIDFKNKIGPFKGQVTGRMSPDGSKGWRIDYDPDKGFHVNWWDHNGSRKRKDWLIGANIIKDGSNDDFYQLIQHFPKG